MTNPYSTRPIPRVLCADDDVEIVSLLRLTFEAHGFEVETALDGHHALHKITTDERRFDLLVTDTRMPHLDGPDLVARARAARFVGPVIVFSASMTEEDRERYFARGVEHIVQKPDLGALLELARRLTRMSSAA